MAPTTETEAAAQVASDRTWDEWKQTLADTWHSVADWFIRFFGGLNAETVAHPYYIAIALLIIYAWPHILLLPWWFGIDAFRRVGSQTRQLASAVATGRTRPRKRDAFIARYRSIVNAGYEPSQVPTFGGTPLSEGNFTMEEDKDLPMVLRVIRWVSLALAVIILGREWYYQLIH